MSRMTSRQKQGTIWFSFLMKIYIHVHGKNANPHHHKQHDTMGTEKEPPTLSNSEKPSNKDHHKHGKIQSLINISNITHQAWKWTHDTKKRKNHQTNYWNTRENMNNPSNNNKSLHTSTTNKKQKQQAIPWNIRHENEPTML